jgi:ATP-dependent helicase/nuclease subunit A
MLRHTMNILAKNLLILASAGSGKTFQLGNRVIGLVAKGVAPEKIVALTFTRKAAGEFADSVLTKLASAAGDEQVAARLRTELRMPEADFSEALERVIRALPRLTLGTIDSFFARIVRGFQYELGMTGGKFDLLEGPRAAAVADEILAAILGETLEDSSGDDFLHAFRRATVGKEHQGVTEGLRGFIKTWQGRFRTARDLDWGRHDLAGVALEDWDEYKYELAATVSRGLASIEFTRKDQQLALEKVLSTLTAHTIGSGSLGSASGMLASVLKVAATVHGPLTVRYYKDFVIGGPAGDALRDLVNLAARCEMAAALLRTRAVREVIAVYDAQCESQLRRRGLLGFDDVKILMGSWITGEDARLRREAVDFRLDARHEHWLLDEFQDTSRADWTGLLPLIDEAAGEGEGSMFIVGDRKQAIYAWRGGEVGLFDEVMVRYSSRLEIEPMDESWRSCPEVLTLVNQVCGDVSTLRELFGPVADRWKWQDHSPAGPLTATTKRGEARVEVVAGKWEERLERLGALLRELGVGERAMTCGVLVRSNAMVREVADDLRAKGFDVIEEGRREPAKDNPVGIALGHLLKWLANPADTFSREIVEMSPFAATLRADFGEQWQKMWEGLLVIASEQGFAAMIERVVADCWADWSDFGKRRAGDIVMALASLDAQGAATPHEAAEWIARLEVSQSPGVAAVQVMTIHKSKGLGFDVVILPEVPNDRVPASQYFEVAEGDGWITQTPPQWARMLIPEMCKAEAEWEAVQRYQAFCMLYVALTRSKRGLYVFLEPPTTSQDADKPSLANWLARSVSAGNKPGIAFQSGAADWVTTFSSSSRTQDSVILPSLAASITRRVRIHPSVILEKSEPPAPPSAAGLRFGSEVHTLLERVGWVDETPPDLPVSEAGAWVRKLLATPSLRPLFERSDRQIDLLREQPVDTIIDGKWWSGVIDRVHLHRDGTGAVSRVQMIDFKTDAVSEASELTAKYSSQMDAYRKMMQLIYPAAQVECLLLSTGCNPCIAW